MGQNSISSPAKAYQGQIAEPGAPKYCVSCFAEGSGINAGELVIRGTNKQKQAMTAVGASDLDAGNLLGVVVLETSRPYKTTMIEAGDPLSVMRMGSVYMTFGEAVTAGEQVTMVLATGVLGGVAEGTAAGSIATGTVVVPGLRIAETTTGSGLARVEVNLFGLQTAGTNGSL